MYSGCDTLSLQILFVYFLVLPSLLHPSIFFNYLLYFKKKYCHGYEVLVTTWVFDKFGMQNMMIVGLVSYFIDPMDQ